MNFEAAYLAALAALIVSLGGVVPTAPALNFRDSELAHLRAIVLAVGGTLPGVQLNYHDLVLANWRAAIVARGGTVPGVQLNFRLSHLLHVQAFQLALGNSVAFSGNYHEALLQLVRSGAAGLNFSALTALPAWRRSSAGWIDQATIDSFAKANIWLDAFAAFSDTAATVPALAGDAVAAIKDNAVARTWTQSNSVNRPVQAASPTRLTGDYTKTLQGSPTAATGANIVIATNAGILNATGNIPASLTMQNIPGMIHWVSGALDSADIDRIKAFAVAEGAVDNNFAGITNFSNYFRTFSFLTSFPLINTAAGTNFNNAWNGCSGLTSFPLIDTVAGTNFNAAWSNCTGLTSFPLINTAAGTTFGETWLNCTGLTSFPLINTAAGTSFSTTWQGCTGLTSFPLINTAAGTNFSQAWNGCSGLTSFPASFFNGCSATNFTNSFLNTALTQASIDNILVSINSNSTSNGTFNQSGGSAPSATGNTAIDAMRGRGWTITVTGGY